MRGKIGIVEYSQKAGTLTITIPAYPDPVITGSGKLNLGFYRGPCILRGLSGVASCYIPALSVLLSEYSRTAAEELRQRRERKTSSIKDYMSRV